MGVALDGRHLRDLTMGLVIPPPTLVDNGKEPTCEFIPMGFPIRETEETARLMHSASATGKQSKLFFARTGYICPQCKTKASELPVDCAVCGLKLVLAPHLARSFHHLFPVPPFEEVAESKEICSKDKTMTIEFRISSLTSMSLPDTQQLSKLGYSHESGVKEIVLDNELLRTSEDCDRCCFSCLKPIGLKIVDDMKRKKRKNR
jgi:transcription factor Ssl1